MPPMFCALKGIIVKDKRFLVVKDRDGDIVFWDLPGGKMEYGENPYHTLAREIKEETCLEIEIGKPLGMFWIIRKKDDGQVVYTVFVCKPKTNKIDINQNPAEEFISEFKWVTKEEFLSDKYTVHNKSLKELISKLEM